MEIEKPVSQVKKPRPYKKAEKQQDVKVEE